MLVGLGKAFAGVARATEALVGDVADDLKSVFVGDGMDDLKSWIGAFVVAGPLSVGSLETRGIPDVVFSGLAEEEDE